MVFELIQTSCRIMAAVGESDSADYGYTWRVQVNEYGPGKDGRINWTREPLVAAISSLIEGARVFALNESQHQAANKQFGKSVKEIIGWLKNVTDTGTAIEADLCILKSAQWLRDGLVDSFERGKPDLFGLSFDAVGRAINKMVAGKMMKEPVEIKSVEVDVVYNPTNNGKFLRLAAAEEAGQKGDTDMFEKLLAALQSKRPELHTQIQAGITAGTMTQDQALEQIAAATVTASDAAPLVSALVAAMKESAAGLPSSQSPQLEQMQLIACNMTLTSTLAASKLPEPVQDKLRASFKDVVFKDESLQAAIKAEKEMLDKLSASGAVSGAGDVRVVVGRETGDKLQAAMDQMLNVNVSDDLRIVPAFKSLQAAYIEMTGDSDLTFAPTRRMQASFDSTSFPQALGNTLHRRIVQDYRATSDYGLSLIVGAQSIRNATDFRPLESFIVGYYGDLPTVDTDIDDYPDLGVVGEDAIEYALMEHGGTIRITRKMILGNDLNLINRIVSRIGRGARRGEARKAWTPLISNATYKGDNKAIFHVDHGNLGTTAYGMTSALAAKTAMAQQTEPDSGERFPNRPVTVSFPTELFGIVTNVNSFNPQAVTVDNANSMYGFFKPEKLFENPLMTDASDWIMLADPNEAEIVEMAYLNGQREPQMFIASDPSSGGQMFLNGSIMYRVSHDYNAEVVDYRPAYKAVVA